MSDFNLVAIVGMHRSGTSFVAETIQRMGVPLGRELLAANEFNKRGYFEDITVVEIHNKLLVGLQRSWGTIRHTFLLPKDWQKTKAAAEAKLALLEYLSQEIEAHREAGIWAVKDPRLSLFLPLWTEVAKELGVNLKLVYCLRDKESVAASLERRDKSPRAASRIIWLNYNSYIIQNANDLPTLLVGFEDWQENGDAIIQKLADFCAVSLPDDNSSVFDKSLTINDKAPSGIWWDAAQAACLGYEITPELSALAQRHFESLQDLQIWSDFVEDEAVRKTVYARLEIDIEHYRAKLKEFMLTAKENLATYEQSNATLAQDLADAQVGIDNATLEAEKNLIAYQTVDGLLSQERINAEAMRGLMEEKILQVQAELEVKDKEWDSSVALLQAELAEMTMTARKNLMAYQTIDALCAAEKERADGLQSLLDHGQLNE